VQDLRTGDPTKVGEYTVLGRLGHGAMGRVFLARSPGGRPVAVKVIRSELSDDAGFRERFRQEVAAMRAVGGFWTAAVVDADPAAMWLATEYVPGPTLLAAVTSHGPLPVPALRRLVAGLAEALQAIHATGLVHRDLKPANVLLAGDGPRVLDFGIAKALESVDLTATGMFVGTPGFLSPEQIEGREAMPASDVFALGSVLVYAATGEGPFGTGEVPGLLYRAVHTDPDLDRVPDELRPLAARCLVRDPDARPTPADLLSEVGTPDAAEWLPAPVRAMVTEQETELGSPRPRVPTRAYTKAGPPLPFGKGGKAGKAGASANPVPPKPAVTPRTPAKPPTAEWPATGKPPVADPPGNGRPPVADPPGNGMPAGNPAAPPQAGPAGPGPAATPPPPQANQAAPPAGPGSGPVKQPTGGKAVFRVSRVWALVFGVLSTLAMFTCLAFAQGAGAQHKDVVALAFLGGAVFFLLPALRQWWNVAKPRRWLSVSPEGLTVGRGKQEKQLRWAELARVRIVDHKRRPWVVVWPHGETSGLGATYAGGHRVFPVGHERRTPARRREARELRAALAWYGRAVFDPSR
jgi:serine/threonine protein kinase